MLSPLMLTVKKETQWQVLWVCVRRSEVYF